MGIGWFVHVSFFFLPTFWTDVLQSPPTDYVSIDCYTTFIAHRFHSRNRPLFSPPSPTTRTQYPVFFSTLLFPFLFNICLQSANLFRSKFLQLFGIVIGSEKWAVGFPWFWTQTKCSMKFQKLVICF